MIGFLPVTGFRSFRSRLIVFLLILLLPVLGGIYLYVTRNNHSYTEQTINSYLESGAGVFDFTLQQQSQSLVSILSSLTWDFGFRSAFGSGDEETLFGASLNVLDRSLGGVNTLIIVDMEGNVIIDTALQGFHKLSGSWMQLLKEADSNPDGLAEAIISVDRVPHRLIAVPLFLPHQVAWIIGGYPLDQDVLNRVKRNTLSDVSLVKVSSTGNEVIASTLPSEHWGSLGTEYDPNANTVSGLQQFDLGGQVYGSLTRVLSEDVLAGGRLVALIHRSYQENLANDQQFQQRLAQFYLIILAVSILAVMVLAQTITRPVQRLAGFVSRIEHGDYGASIKIQTRDELGQLADSINSMARGLAEKEKVRDLLGKVVSRQIADQLIKNPIDLEGEEKVATVMYVDIKGFTSFCEGKSPRKVLKILNGFLSNVARYVELHNGVVDKFMGDGVMALYGAPVQHRDDVENALNTALTIKSHWQQQAGNTAVKHENNALVPCIGIHTGLVVAGNLGSMDRLNYSVVGDSVNLAARLESLTRYYGVTCIVSENTARQAEGFLYRELDLVCVFGRQDSVRIYELVGETGRVTRPLFEEIRRFENFLTHYRSCQWDEAERILLEFPAKLDYAKLYSLYLKRIAYFRENPPASDWQGIFVFDKK